MKHEKRMTVAAIALAAIFAAWGMDAPLLAQSQPQAQPQSPPPAPAIKRSLLQTQDLGVPGRAAMVTLIELAPGAVIERHTHPGEELGYVLEGTLVMEVDGRAPLALKAGDSYFIEAGRVHGGKGGAAPARVLLTYIVEKGKPFALPAK